MTGVLGTPPVAVLRNRGVPVKLHVLEQNENGRWARTFKDDEPVFETVHVQMTNAVLADITDPVNGWGGLESWQKALRGDAQEALQRTLALCLDWWRDLGAGDEAPDGRRAGIAMLDGEADAYSGALGGAFMLANGVRPERVGEVLAAGVESAAELREKLMDRLAVQAVKISEANSVRVRAALDASDETTQTSPTPEETTTSPNGSTFGSSTADPSTSSGG